MQALVRRFLDERDIDCLDDMREWGYEPTPRQRAYITRQITRERTPLPFREAFARKFTGDKFGEATTHWKKLEDRIHRGLGNPCPLVIVGMSDEIVTFGEGKAALAEVEAAEEAAACEPAAK